MFLTLVTHVGTEVEGIFRHNGEQKKVQSAIRSFARGNISQWGKKYCFLSFMDLLIPFLAFLVHEIGKKKQWDDGENPQFVAAVLKSWLCQLQYPLLTIELQDSFIAAQGTL